MLAGREALPRLHPLEQNGLAVADRTPNPDVWRAVTAHTRFSEPRHADAKMKCRLFRRQQALDACTGLGVRNAHDDIALDDSALAELGD